jgi:hypothetical protein
MASHCLRGVPSVMHAIFESARKAVPASHRPTHAPHLGGATPRLTSRRYEDLAFFCGTQALPALGTEEHAFVTRILALLRSNFDDGGIARYRRLMQELQDVRWDVAAPLLVAVKDCKWGSLSVGRPGLARACTRALLKTHGAPAAAAFVTALDETMCQLDALSTFERLDLGRADLTRVLARGERHDETTALVVALPEARFGLLWRPSERWEWIEGARDEVFPLVPSHLFELAVARALR